MSISKDDISVLKLTIAGEIDPRMSPYEGRKNLVEIGNILSTIENRYRSNTPARFGSTKLLDTSGNDAGTISKYATISNVCLQKFQYSTWNTSASRKIAATNEKKFRKEIKAALEAYLAGDISLTAPSATHYHAYYVTPSWAASLVRLVRTGPHIFYEDTSITLEQDKISKEQLPAAPENSPPKELLSLFSADPRRYDPKSVVTPNHDIWELLHKHLVADKLGIMGHTGSGHPRNKINAGALQACDAVCRLAETEEVEMSVAIGGGSNGHSINHGGHVSGVGESIDFKPKDGWSGLSQPYRYAETAAAAGANRLGVPHNSSGLHVQRVSVTARPVMSWNYGADTNYEFRNDLQTGVFKSLVYRQRVADLYAGIFIIQVQRALNALGATLQEDDEMGRNTAAALENYYNASGG